ncbi:MAG: RNA pseudouridine synthase [Candidatus Spechtbacteria bacterium]|nr:RNA pseudouridine synthase [Candidatus Spechtbacteria bacterium]
MTMKLKIIYEDNDVLVIDKPAGIAVHPAHKGDNKPTIVGLLSQINPEIKSVGENPLRPGIVHRLDKETSGLMVIAKNNETFFELKKQFQERKVEKKYIALVSGALEKDNGTIEIPLIKIGTRMSASTRNDSKFKDKIRSAITEYKVVKRYREYTLVEIRPKTGRMHQIRVHFASINHPIACDKLYGRKAKRCPPGLNRHFLHASYLSFRLKSALMEFESELPEDLSKALQILS